MKNTILRKHKTVSSMILAATVALSMFGTGCGKKAETDNTKTGEISSSDQESGSVSQSTSAPDESETTTDSTPDTTETTADSEPTSESTLAPYASLDEILIRGDKDYYVPFSNPEHSYSSVQNGWTAPVRAWQASTTARLFSTCSISCPRFASGYAAALHSCPTPSCQ